MQCEISSIDITVRIADAPVATGLTSGLRERTVHAKSALVRFNADGTPRRIEITGPYARANGDVTAVYTTILVNAAEDDHYRPAPQWVLDMIAQVSPR